MVMAHKLLSIAKLPGDFVIIPKHGHNTSKLNLLGGEDIDIIVFLNSPDHLNA